MSGKTVFISDIHLGVYARDIEEKRENEFVAFLKSLEQGVDSLYILGDLFDYWFEYRRVIQKGYFKTFAMLKHLTESGVKIHYLVGNHDFFHSNFFTEYIGVNLIPDHIDIQIEGKRFFLGHGDGLMKKDYGYKILKKILRNKFIQWGYSLIHPDFGVWLASSTSKQSRGYTTAKDYGETDALYATAKLKIEAGFDYVVFGHSHVRTKKEYKDGYYINLGTWLSQPCYGVFDNNNFDIVDWKTNG